MYLYMHHIGTVDDHLQSPTGKRSALDKYLDGLKGIAEYLQETRRSDRQDLTVLPICDFGMLSDKDKNCIPRFTKF